MTQATEATWKTNCPKTILTPNLETPEDIATKSGETHIRDRALPSCKFSRQSARDILPRQKIHIFLYRGLTPLGAIVPYYTFLESSRQGDFKL